MAKKNNAPTRAELQELAATLEPGQRVTVGTRITMTVDGAGRLRFQWRGRIAGRGSRSPGGTCNSYEDAAAERDKFDARKSDSTEKRRERGRKMTIETVFIDEWWPHVREARGQHRPRLRKRLG